MLLWPQIYRENIAKETLRDTLMVESETVKTASSKFKNHKM